MKMTLKKPWLLAGLLVVLATALLCGGCGGDKQTVEQADPGIAVEVVQAELGQIVNSTVVRGNVEATDDVYVAPKAQGVVRSVNVSVGDYISNGQVICQLDTVDLQTALALAKSQYDTLNTSYQEAVKNRDRYAALYAEGAVSLAQYEQAETAVKTMNLEGARLQVQQIQDQINNCTVRSTISGQVAEVSVNPGDMAGSGPVARVVDIKQVKLVANVTESVLASFSQGMEVPVTISAASAEPYIGRVSSMPVAANATMTYPVEIIIDNPNREIMAGMFAEVNVVREQSAAENLIIPKSAVNNDGQVFVVDAQNVAHLRNVETGLSDDNNVEILSGLTAGETVVTVGGYLLSDGAEVRVVSGESEADNTETENNTNDTNAENNDNAENAADGSSAAPANN